MRRLTLTMLASLILPAAAALVPAVMLFHGTALAAPEKADPAVVEMAGAAAGDEEVIQATSAPEPERISGKIYKIDREAKYVGILVAQKRAFKKFRMFMDDKSLVLVAGQPSDLTALSEGQSVEVGYWKKGKQEVIDSIVAN